MPRIQPLRAVISCALLIALLAVPSSRIAAQLTADGQPVSTFDPNANPVADLNTAIAEAQDTHRRILLDVGGQWCIWCKYLDQFFDSHPDLKALRDRNYVWVKINFSRDNENKRFLAQYPHISGYPHIFVLDTGGHFVHSQDTSSLENGHDSYSPDRMKEFLNRWAATQEIDTPIQ